MTGISKEELIQALSQAALDILHGVTSYEKAVDQMDVAGIAESLTDELVIGLSRQASGLLTQPDPKWQPAIALQTLLYVCLDARAEPPPAPVITELAWNFVNAASRALWFVPDPSLYKQATERGLAAVELDRGRGNLRGAGDLLHALGTMNLDPYAANRTPAMFEQEMQAWRTRAANGESWNHVNYYDLEGDGYPSMRDAFAAAAEFYREAATLREDRKRALTLKAFAQTLYNSHLHDLPYDKSEIEQAAREALEYLNEEEDPAVYIETLNYLRFATGDEGDVPGTFPEGWLNRSIDRSVAKLGDDKTVQLVNQAYTEVDDYPKLLRILLDAARLFENSFKNTFYHFAVIRTFIRSMGVETYDLNDPPKEPIEDLFQNAVTASRKEDWDPARFAAALLALADVSVVMNEEAFAIRLVDAAGEAAPYATAKIRDSIAYLRAQLLLNDGVNAVNRKDWNESTKRYAEALAAFLDAGAVQRISDVLARLADVVKRGDRDAVVSVCALLEDRIDSIEVVAGDRVTQQVQTVLEYAVRNQLERGADSRVLWRLIQLSSARRFAAMLAAGSAYQVHSERVAPQLLQRIRELRTEVFEEGYVETAGDRLADGILLSPYLVGGVQMGGESAAERLANLRHQYDQLLYNALVRSAEGKAGLLAAEADLRATIGPADVIIQYYVVDASEDGQTPATLVSAVTTHEETTWMAVRFGSKQPRIKMVIDGVAVELTELSAMIQSLREHIQEDPEGESLSKDAGASIESVSSLLIEPIHERLDELLQAGKRHLCIVPPGPLAYAPFHILGKVPGALCEPWSISYLPTLQLLVRNYGGPTLLRRRNATVTACGISFEGNTAGYDELPEAVSEATAVAKTMGSEPLLEEDATERSLLEALLNSQYVHIATHGHQNAVAPCFHKLVLTPDGTDDGDLHAHELLGMDLRGLKLVTLSACETAVGRFDRGMNPHGLPATLLLAGAETVIGTLWEIETACSERFFTTLYTLLSSGQSKLDAYSGALRVAREHHPEFRDWGGFYFLGDWN